MPEVVHKFRKNLLWDLLTSFPRVTPISVFVMVILATLVVAASIERASRTERRLAVNERTSSLGHDLERRASATQAYLISGAALFNSGLEIKRETFGQFVSVIEKNDDYRGILAIGWSEVVKPRQAGTRAEVPQQQQTQAIKFISPETPSNQAVRGYDMHREHIRRGAMDRAAATGNPAVTARVTLFQDQGTVDRPGVLMYMPVFERGASPAARGPLRGYVYAALRVDDYITAALAHQLDPAMPLEIYDEIEAPDHLLYSRGLAISPDRAVTRTAAIADRHWVIKSSAPPATIISRTGILILLAGLIIAAMLTYIVQLAFEQAIAARYQLRVQREQESIRTTLTRELNHRVKNTLANVLSILSLSRRGATDLDQFVDRFSGRVRALSATHNLLMQTSWGTTKISAVIDAELAPFIDQAHSRVIVTGDNFELAPSDALSLGLLIHELVTNAAKFGALSGEHGQVLLSWHKAEARHVLFEWVEQGGPSVPAERKRGFGSDLIEKVISRELRSDIKLQFEQAGVRCRFLVPLRTAGPFAIRQPT